MSRNRMVTCSYYKKTELQNWIIAILYESQFFAAFFFFFFGFILMYTWIYKDELLPGSAVPVSFI